ncbi:MAG: alpha-isopropylmalate synthase regulatory domain-containing protein, partial [Brevinematales bacterium]
AGAIQKETEKTGMELAPERIFEIFKMEYLENHKPLQLMKYKIEENQNLSQNENLVQIQATVVLNGKESEISGQGNGPIDAFFHAMREIGIPEYNFVSYDEHALSEGSDSKAVAYICLEDKAGDRKYGVGIAQNISTASLNAIVSAINRLGL